MRRRAAEPSTLESVGPLIRNVLRRFGLDRRLEEFRAVGLWPEVVGPLIAVQSRAVEIRDGVLFVHVESNVWMQELGMLREEIAARLNARLGAPHVRKIVLSLERTPRPRTEHGSRGGEESE
jgi:predicted nucleic acid-binding Zn ribbon protein